MSPIERKTLKILSGAKVRCEAPSTGEVGQRLWEALTEQEKKSNPSPLGLAILAAPHLVALRRQDFVILNRHGWSITVKGLKALEC